VTGSHGGRRCHTQRHNHGRFCWRCLTGVTQRCRSHLWWPWSHTVYQRSPVLCHLMVTERLFPAQQNILQPFLVLNTRSANLISWIHTDNLEHGTEAFVANHVEYKQTDMFLEMGERTWSLRNILPTRRIHASSFTCDFKFIADLLSISSAHTSPTDMATQALVQCFLAAKIT
jgi:hypothetical protein